MRLEGLGNMQRNRELFAALIMIIVLLGLAIGPCSAAMERELLVAGL